MCVNIFWAGYMMAQEYCVSCFLGWNSAVGSLQKHLLAWKYVDMVSLSPYVKVLNCENCEVMTIL